MTQTNRDALGALYEATSIGDFSTESSIFDPHFVYVSEVGDTDPGPHYGYDAYAGYMRRFLENWDNWRIEALGFRAVGDTFVVEVHRSAQGRASGVPIADTAYHVWTFRGSRAVRLDVFKDESAALEAVGLAG